MPYSPTTWANQVTALNAAHMNNLEGGIEAAPYGPDASTGESPVSDGAGGWLYVTSTTNAKTYGAQGDGSHDDKAHIQDAIDDASADGGGIVLLPEGTYMISSGLTLPSGVTLQGVGTSAQYGSATPTPVACTTIKASAAMMAMITQASVAGGGIRDLTLDCNSNASVGVLGDGAFGTYNPNVVIKNTATIVSSPGSCVFANNGASKDTITRTGGSWVTDGIVPGAKIAVTGTGSNNGTYTVYSVTSPTVLTLVASDALTNETSTATLTTGGIGIWYRVTGTTANVGNSWNKWPSLVMGSTHTNICLDGNTAAMYPSAANANTCHNYFGSLEVRFGDARNSHGINLEECDNNTFVDVFMGATGTGYSTYFGAYARCNYFYHLQPAGSGVYCETPAAANESNIVFGYDQDNSQPDPVLNTGAALDWWSVGTNGQGLTLSGTSSLTAPSVTVSADPGALVFSAGTNTWIDYHVSQSALRFVVGNVAAVQLSSTLVGLASGVDLSMVGDSSTARSIIAGGTNGLKIGTDPSQKLGFYNATPVIQPTGSTDVVAGLVNLGLRAATSNPAMNIGTGAITAGSVSVSADPQAIIFSSGANTFIDYHVAQSAMRLVVGNVASVQVGSTAVGLAVNLEMNSHKITGLAAGTTAGDGMRYEQFFGAASAGALLFPGLVDLQVFGPTASDTWVKPASGKVAMIIAFGPGGGGGGGVGGANSLYGGAGGGSGDVMVAYLPYAALPSSCTVQVGAGGAGGAGSATTTGTAGSNGSRSTIFDTGNNTLVAPAGGGGGAGGTVQGAAGAAGAAGTATTYTGYTIASVESAASPGGQSSITTNAAASPGGGAGGAGAGITAAGAVAGTGGANGAVGVTFAAAASAPTSPAGQAGAVLGNAPFPFGTTVRFGGGGGGAKTTGTAGAGGVGYNGGGGGGGGSEPSGGTGGAGGTGGDGRLVVAVFN